MNEGFGAALLAAQDDDGSWAGGAHFPRGFFDAPEPHQPWVATSRSPNDLREWGMPADAMGDTKWLTLFATRSLEWWDGAH